MRAGSICPNASAPSSHAWWAHRRTRSSWATATSVNLFKLVVAALRHQRGRTRILTDNLNFPSDLYVLQGAIDLLGNQHRLEVIPSPDGIHGPAAALAAALDSDVALVTLSHTVFKSGYTYDMAAITAPGPCRGRARLVGPESRRGQRARGSQRRTARIWR